ncbi:MAG: nickel pincer cofactor biosynthesis protein LarB [Tissierellia bacterium]|nr:nickel pincer cofactor biosynthesis protein LarB [Tissierellia bacterium]
MDKNYIEEILQKYKEGSISLEGAMESLRELPYEDLGFAKVDHHRALRNGVPEVIYGAGKTCEQILKIMESLEKRSNVLVTRVPETVYSTIKQRFPQADYSPLAKVMILKNHEIKIKPGYVAVVTGGTSDMAVAEEAALTLELFGNRVERVYDVGVAGLHRLLDKRDILYHANVVIAIAGMEGALASVVGGLVDAPVIAVPTSVGYGASFGGVAALLSMLNSCASGVSVVNIDNGFGAGFLAARINEKIGG